MDRDIEHIVYLAACRISSLLDIFLQLVFADSFLKRLWLPQLMLLAFDNSSKRLEFAFHTQKIAGDLGLLYFAS